MYFLLLLEKWAFQSSRMHGGGPALQPAQKAPAHIRDCLRARGSRRSVPDSHEQSLRMRALREAPCKASSWLWLMPRFCNTYNTHVWGGHTEYIVPLPMFKYSFSWAFDVVITVCIQSEIILVQSPRSRFKQKNRTWLQIQMFDIETKLLMIFYMLTLLGMCLWYVWYGLWSNVVSHLTDCIIKRE